MEDYVSYEEFEDEDDDDVNETEVRRIATEMDMELDDYDRFHSGYGFKPQRHRKSRFPGFDGDAFGDAIDDSSFFNSFEDDFDDSDIL